MFSDAHLPGHMQHMTILHKLSQLLCMFPALDVLGFTTSFAGTSFKKHQDLRLDLKFLQDSSLLGAASRDELLGEGNRSHWDSVVLLKPMACTRAGD